MKGSNLLLDLGSRIIRSLPEFRGLGRLVPRCNQLLLSLGAQPIVKAKLKNGTTMVVDLRTITELNAYYRGEYDRDLAETVCSLLDGPAPVFFDVGANIGFYTVAISNFFKSKGISGHVIAFEPLEGNYQRLMENLRLNGLESYSSVFKIGLSSRCQDADLVLREDFLRGSKTGNASISTNEMFDAGFERVKVHLERLDYFWTDLQDTLQTIDLIKLDIEGHEDFCLEGGQKTLQKYRPTILMEVAKPYYNARGIEINPRFLSLIPDDYQIYRRDGSKWKGIKSLDECQTQDNVFLVPEEKLGVANYKVFGSA